jgi:cytochrome c551/c552
MSKVLSQAELTFAECCPRQDCRFIYQNFTCSICHLIHDKALVTAWSELAEEFHDFELSVFNLPGFVDVGRQDNASVRSLYAYLVMFGRRLECTPFSGVEVFAA